jgi:predicted Zn-dependent protease with MMP-like domain
MATGENRGSDLPGWVDEVAPGADAVEQLAREAVETLPPPWQDMARAVAIRVADFATEDMLDGLDIDDPFELTGLYDGVPMTEKSVADQPRGPDAIWLFRRPILDEWATRGTVTLREIVTHVLVHELAHHFGWSDDDIAAIDPWWEMDED